MHKQNRLPAYALCHIAYIVVAGVVVYIYILQIGQRNVLCSARVSSASRIACLVVGVGVVFTKKPFQLLEGRDDLPWPQDDTNLEKALG